MTTQTICRKATRIIEARGWIAGLSIGPNDEVCAGQAMAEAVGEGNLAAYFAARTEFTRALTRGQDEEGLEKWNDAPGRTAEQVIEALRAFAAPR